MKNIFSNIDFQIGLLINVLNCIEEKDYTLSINGKDASVGSHVRHIIEFLEILLIAKPGEIVNYSNRERKKELELNLSSAIEFLGNVRKRIHREDRALKIEEDGDIFSSSYLRELLYQNEHIVHHSAIIRMKLDRISSVQFDECFGYAKSTLLSNQKSVPT